MQYDVIEYRRGALRTNEAERIRSARRTRYVAALGALLAAFVLRVIAQLVQLIAPVAWLPPFTAWDSGALPYGVVSARARRQRGGG